MRTRYLNGGLGNDTVNGGAGNDTYLSLLTLSPLGLTVPTGADTFFDESGTDSVAISRLADVTRAERDGDDLLVGFLGGSFRVVEHYDGHPIENLKRAGPRSPFRHAC